MTSLAILGAGAFGTALALVSARAGRSVILWGRNAGQIAAMREKRENQTHLPGVPLPAAIEITDDLAAACMAETLLLAIPTQSLRAAATQFAPYLRPDSALVAAAKGIEQATGRFVTDVLRAVMPDSRPGILSGPSFADDIARGLPTAVTLAAADMANAHRLAQSLAGPGFRIYHTDDIAGVEIGGAAKNVLAIGAGIVIGAGLGESARAALIARGFAEMRRFAQAFGARGDTLMGLSGLGDLVLTASSPQSRNFAFGFSLGQGRSLAEAATGKLAEGAFTAPALVMKARTLGIEMPISEAVSAVVAGQLGIREAISGLIGRPQKSE